MHKAKQKVFCQYWISGRLWNHVKQWNAFIKPIDDLLRAYWMCVGRNGRKLGGMIPSDIFPSGYFAKNELSLWYSSVESCRLVISRFGSPWCMVTETLPSAFIDSRTSQCDTSMTMTPSTSSVLWTSFAARSYTLSIEEPTIRSEHTWACISVSVSKHSRLNCSIWMCRSRWYQWRNHKKKRLLNSEFDLVYAVESAKGICNLSWEATNSDSPYLSIIPFHAWQWPVQH